MVKYSRHITDSPLQTQKIARILAKEIMEKELQKTAFVLALMGELGAGKTTFLQGLAKELGIKEKILSPTFVIMRNFKIHKKSFGFASFYHVDCYRIIKPKEILSLDFKKIIANPKNIVAVEWAERIKKILPKNTMTLKFKFISESKREINVEYNKQVCFGGLHLRNKQV